MAKYMVGFFLFLCGLCLESLKAENLTPEQYNESYVGQKGINGNELYDLDKEQLSRRIADFVRLGVKWVRLDFDWSIVQPHSAESYEWSKYDRVIHALSSNNVKVLGLLAYTPPWANGGNRSKYFPPTDINGFAKFSEEAARRYDIGKVPVWEVWNEPNLAQFWQPVADPVAYSRLLISASVAIKRVSPNVKVLSGGLAQPYKSAKDWDARDFLKEIYKSGAGRYIDAVGNHPYTTPHLPSSVQGANWRKMSLGIPSMRDIMIINGDKDKKIWITEFGAPTSGTSQFDVTVTEKVQAQMVEDVYKVAKSVNWVGPVFWYNYADFCPILLGKSSECYYGLVRADGTQKPSYSSYMNAR